MNEHIGTLISAATQKKQKGEGTTFAVRVEGEEKFTYYINREQDAHLKDIASKLVDTVVVVTYEVSGIFRNITSIEPATEQEAKAVNGRDKAIAEQVAAKIAAELWIADKIDQSHHLARAVVIWCDLKLGIDPNIPGRQEENAPLKEEKTQPPDEPSLSLEDIDMSHIPNLGQFYLRCRKYYPELKTKADILGKLGCKDESELGDLDAAWHKFVYKMSNDPTKS